jgi:DNA repair protein RadA/Sms
MIPAPPRESPQLLEAVPAQGQEQLAEAAKPGLSADLVPKADAPNKPIQGLTIHAVERIEQAIEVLRAL